ncbi:unnamed protein product [Ostreobium quekettii]|uniref:Protein kinase domain-containing protein n=1 Tax=Ostreobium quekettii TaxID=121088 RepID=A0A8S1JEZ4_9CHLO|nr:unnamed protein product [Ostreobium quekettii]|eukprot:evm.model.scf_826.3 EVM.evm.TU.scf_826.3   scf_826:49029-50517(-)
MADSETGLPEVAKVLEGYPRYQIVKVLGSGTFGTVVLANDQERDGERIAVKLVEINDRVPKYVWREIENHRQLLKHPHIIEFYDVFKPVEGRVAISMEYADGGNLFQYVRKLRRLEEELARWLFQMLILAVDYCHRKGVVSRDIKLENILLKKSTFLPVVKLCDFGFSKNVNIHSIPRSKVGSLDYMAPEVVDARGRIEYDAKKSDVWSCGVVLYVMLTGMYPFEGGMRGAPQDKRKDDVIRRIRRIEYTVPNHVSMDARDLIEQCLTDSEHRISMAEIVQHPWFMKNFPEEARTMNATILADQEAAAAGEEPSGGSISYNWSLDPRRQRDIMDPEWYEPMIDEELKNDHDDGVDVLAADLKNQQIRGNPGNH